MTQPFYQLFGIWEIEGSSLTVTLSGSDTLPIACKYLQISNNTVDYDVCTYVHVTVDEAYNRILAKAKLGYTLIRPDLPNTLTPYDTKYPHIGEILERRKQPVKQPNHLYIWLNNS